jgi:hypothetical protein
MSKNGFANKPALVTELSRLLTEDGAITATTFVPTGWEPATTTLTDVQSVDTNSNKGFVISATSSWLFIGACFSFDYNIDNPNVLTIVASCNSNGEVIHDFNGGLDGTSGLYYVVDYLTQDIVPVEGGETTPGMLVVTAEPGLLTPTSAHTVQDLINAFLNNPYSGDSGVTSRKLYSFIVANIVDICDDYSFYQSGGGNILLTFADGSVYLDTNEFDSGDTAINTSGANTWVNLTNKIRIDVAMPLPPLISSTAPDSTNEIVVYGADNPAATLTLGTAGGNNIAENHNSRPEMLLALLSSTGTGFAQRYSTTSQDVLLYYAVRLGTTSEVADGTVRISAPIII